MKKRIFASLLAICMLGTSVFAAETVVFEESFELEPVDGLYVSMPEIRAYSENLLTNTGTFEDGAKTSIGAGSGSTAVVDTEAHTDAKSLRFTLSSGKTSGSVQPGALAGKLEAGVYEIEAYVKSAQPYHVAVGLQPTTCGNFGKAATASEKMGGGVTNTGHMKGRIDAADEWQRVVGRIVFKKSPVGVYQTNTSTSKYTVNSDGTITFNGVTEPAVFAEDSNFPFCFDISALAVSDTTAPLYFDDIKVRKVENAVASTIAAQEGMPTYPVSALAGKTNAQAVMYAKNESGAAKDLTLITVYYNADGSLNQVLNVYKTSVADSDAIQYVESNEFSVPAAATAGEIKTFAWSNAEQIFPYTDATDSTFVPNLERTEGTADEGYDFRSIALPGTDNVFSFDNFTTSIIGLSTSAYANQVNGGYARTGARSLFIMPLESKGDTRVTASGVNFPVKPGTKYRLEFYVMMGNAGSLCARVSGASEFGDIRGGAKMPVQTWTSSDITQFQNTAKAGEIEKLAASANNGVAQIKYLIPYAPTAGNHARILGTIGKWSKMVCEFETPAADALAADYKQYSATNPGAEDNYWDFFGNYMSLSLITENGASQLNGSVGSGAWVDDIVVYEITE